MKKWLILLVILFIGFTSAGNNYDISSLLLKVNVHHGDFVNKSFDIVSKVGGDFQIELLGMDGVSLSERSFHLDVGEKKNVVVSFDSFLLNPDVYVGSIKISSNGDDSFLPVVFEVESEDVFFDVNLEVPSNYLEVSPGDKVIVNVRIFDLAESKLNGSFGMTNVNLEYVVSGINGEIIFSDSEEVAIQGKTDLTKTLVLPDNMKEGEYFFTAVVKFESSVGVSSSSFKVIDSGDVVKNNAKPNIVSLLISFLALILVLFAIHLMHDRDKNRTNKENVKKTSENKVEELTASVLRKIMKKKHDKA